MSAPAAARIDTLNGVTITNATIVGGSLNGTTGAGSGGIGDNASTTTFFATIGHFATGLVDALTSAVAVISNLTANTITATNVTFANATTTNLAAINASTTNLTTGSLTLGTQTGVLYATGGLLAALASGADGKVLKLAGGVPTWSTDIVSGGGSLLWATTTDSLAAYLSPPSTILLVGASGTTTTGNILELAGNSLFRGNLIAYKSVTAPAFIATSTIASQFPYASTTAITSVNASITNATSTALYASNGGFGTLVTSGWGLFGGTVGIGTTSPSTPLVIDSTAASGTLLRIANGSLGGHMWDLLSTGSGNTGGAGRFDVFDKTVGVARVSIAANGNVGIGTTSPSTNLSVTGNAYLTGNITVGDATSTRANLGLPYATPYQAGWYNITAWGDSLTAGAEDGTGITFPNQLAALIPGSVVTNEGVGGQTSTQIAVREGGVGTTATVSGGTIPVSGGVIVTFPGGYEPVTSQGPSPGVYGSLAGVAGLVTLSGSTYTFNVLNGTTTVSTSGAVPFIPSLGSLNSGTVILWEGRNNASAVSQVEADIAASVAALPSNRYLILSVENGAGEGTGTGTYTNITTINSYLAATYPGHYLDIRGYLVQNGLSSAGLTPTAQDVTDIGNDIPPSSLRTDSIHLNNAGYKVVATQVAKWINSFNSANAAVVTYPQLANVIANPTLSGLTIASTTYSVASGTSTISYVLSPLLTVASSTAAAPGLTVLSSGMVGLGTSTPNSILQIEGPPSNNAFTGTAHLGLFLTSYSYGMSGLDFGGLNSVNPEARIAMLSSPLGSILQFGTTDCWSCGVDRTAMTINYYGHVGVGSTTPYAMLAVTGSGSGTGVNFQTTNASNVPLVTSLDNGNFGVGTTSPGSLLSIGNTNGINFSTATTSFNTTGGINLNSGCFAYQGTCLSSTGSFSNTLANGGTATSTFFPGGVIFSDGAKLTQKSNFFWDNINGRLGVGTSSPISTLHVLNHTAVNSFMGTTSEMLTIDGAGITGVDFNDAGGAGNMLPKARIAMYNNALGSYLALGTTAGWTSGITNQALTIDYNGNVGIGTTTPNSVLQVNGPTSGTGLTGTAHLGLFTTSNSYGVSGIDFGGKNSINPEARVVMSTSAGGSLLNFGTSNNFNSGITNTAMTIDPNGNVGVGTTSPSARLTVWGPDTASTSAFAVANSASTTAFAVYDNGNATYSGTLFQSSDQRLKTNIATLDGSSTLTALLNLNPITYTRIDHPEQGATLGFLAQQVQRIFPDLVATSSGTDLTPDGTLTLNYQGLIAPIVSAIQQLSAQLASLAKSITTDVITAATGNFSVGNFSNQLCVGTTCVTPAEFQAMVAASHAPSLAETAAATPIASTTLSLNGNNPATWPLGSAWSDNLGALFTHDGQSETLSSTSTVDTTAPGTTTIDYWAQIPSSQQWLHATRDVVISASGLDAVGTSSAPTAN